MAAKINISQLNDLRETVSLLLQEAYELSSANEKAKAGTAITTPIVIVLHDGNLRTVYRSAKIDGDVEVVHISKMDAYEGPLPKRCEKYMAKIASFMEKRQLYQKRGAITDKTPNLFEEKE